MFALRLLMEHLYARRLEHRGGGRGLIGLALTLIGIYESWSWFVAFFHVWTPLPPSLWRW